MGITDGRFNEIGRKRRSIVAHAWSFPIYIDSKGGRKRKYEEKPHCSSKELNVEVSSQTKILELLGVCEQI